MNHFGFVLLTAARVESDGAVEQVRQHCCYVGIGKELRHTEPVRLAHMLSRVGGNGATAATSRASTKPIWPSPADEANLLVWAMLGAVVPRR